MNPWRVATSLAVLRKEVDELWPARSRASDGTVGDLAHQSRNSDHNPFVLDSNGIGVVRAFDITHDPGDGPDAPVLAEHFRQLGRAGDGRIRYIISNARIASSIDGWHWRPYTGLNAHRQHVHVSVSTLARYYDSAGPWGIADLGGLSMADIDKIIKHLRHVDAHLHQLKETVDAVDRRVRQVEEQVPGNLHTAIPEIRRNLRDVAGAVRVATQDIEGDPAADDRPEWTAEAVRQ